MKKLLLTLLGALLALPAFARDFEYTYEGQTLTYTVINEAAKTVKTKDGYYYDNHYIPGNNVSGNLIIPSTVENGGISYAVTAIGNYAFYDCTGLTSVEIPNSVTKIGERAFKGCTGLTSVSIPNSVTEIGEHLFRECTGLTSVEIPNSVTSIGWSAFKGCTGLTSVSIPNSVTSIGSSAFEDCTGLKEVYFNAENCSTCGSYNSPAFPKTVESIVLGEKVSVIPDYAFKGITGLSQITIPNSVTSIGHNAFSGCTGLTTVTIPNSVTEIGGDAFRGCTGLTSVNIPNSVTEIGGGAFSGCTGLTTVTIPNSVTEIGGDAFRGCTGLTSVNIPNSVTEIGGGAFSGCTGLTSVEIPNSVTTIGNGTFGSCSQLTEIKVADGNPNYSSLDGVLFNKDQTTLLQFPGGKGPNYIIPNTVISFGWRPFRDCVGLKSVVISDNIIDIDNYLFSHSSQLESVKFGRSVATIGYYAFAYCTNLKSIEFGPSILYIDKEAFEQCLNISEYIVDEDNPNYSSLDGVLFNKDKTTLIQYAKGKQNTEYSIPKSVENICYYAFGNCKTLKCIEIPKSVTNIEDEAFYLCNFDFVYSCSDVPPTCASSVFGGGSTYSQAILYVPVGSMETYKETSPWKYFKTIKEDPNLGIKETESPNGSIEIVDGAIVVKGSGDVSVYNMMGAQVYSGAVGRIELPGGIYVVVTDSLTKKVKI